MDNIDGENVNEEGMDCDGSACGLGSVEEESTWSLPLSNETLSLQSGKESPSIISGMVFEDGYTWRKYGQKETIMGTTNSYYKCAYQNCPVRKQRQQLHNGDISCIYKGVHNHPTPKLNSTVSVEKESTWSLPLSNETLSLQSGKESPSIISGMVFEDGYTWRKYGQKKTIMGTTDSYYKCAYQNCPVRKQRKQLHNGDISCIYKGVHNHPTPKLNSTVSVDCVQSAVEQTLPRIVQWRDLIRIELMDSKICELPESPYFPKLKVLLLQRNVDLMEIPDSFFNHMPLLLHLDLSYTSIRDLPPSISKLIQLKKFYLRGCDLFLELPPEIGQLENLQEFDLEGTLITHLPKEVGDLINLQSLTLCFDRCHIVPGHANQISNSTIIPPGVLSNLIQLNYLSINVDPEDERWNENVNIVLVEIFGLERLETVSIYVPKAELLELIPSKKSFNFRLVVGHHLQRFISRVTPEVELDFKRSDNSMKFVNGVDVPNGVKMNLEHLKALYLDRHMTIKTLSDFELKNLKRLQVCILAECNAMETIVDASHSHDGRALANLKSLVVFYMKNLRSICEGPNPSFLFLKSLALHTCPMITTIFTLDSINNFPFLEEIVVEDCPKVTTLTSHHSPEQKPVFFLPNLKMISLLYLPELVNICNGLHLGPILEKMVFYYCPKLQSLSKSELSSTSLKVIKGERMWWEALTWNAAEWGDAAPPKLVEQIFSPFNEDADIMKQLAAHQETQISTHQDEFMRKRKIPVVLEGRRPPPLRVGKESRTFRKPVKPAKPVIVYCTDASEFKKTVEGFTGQSSGERTSYFPEVNDITQMLEESTAFNNDDDMEQMTVDS